MPVFCTNVNNYFSGQMDRMWAEWNEYRLADPPCDETETKVQIKFKFDSSFKSAIMGGEGLGTLDQTIYIDYFPSERIDFANKVSTTNKCIFKDNLYSAYLSDNLPLITGGTFWEITLNGRTLTRVAGGDNKEGVNIAFVGDNSVCPSGTARVYLEIAFDDTPWQNTYQIKDTVSGAPVVDTYFSASHPTEIRFEGAEGHTLFVERCLSEGDYTFTINDRAGNGIDGGSWAIYLNDGTSLASGDGNFGSAASASFIIGDPTTGTAPVPSPSTSAPIPNTPATPAPIPSPVPVSVATSAPVPNTPATPAPILSPIPISVTPCDCEVQGSKFCNHDDGATGACESCPGSVAECGEIGLPSRGVESCLTFCSPAATPDTLSPTTAPPTPGVGLCFAGTNFVDVRDKGKTQINELQVGDYVRVGDSKFERVYSFGHRDEHSEAEFIQLLPSQLELSPSHMVFIKGRRGATPASLIKVGDILFGKDGNEVVVEAVHTVVRKGLYAPFTRSGKLLVNGVLSSNYISMQNSDNLMLGSVMTPFTHQWLARTFLLLHRTWSLGLGLSDTNLDNGLAAWIDPPYRFFMWVLKQHPVFLGMVMLPIIGMLGLFSLFETDLSYPVAVFALVISFICFRRYWNYSSRTRKV